MLPNSLLQFVGIVYITLCSCSGGFTLSSGAKIITFYCVISTSNSDNPCQGYNFTEKNTLYNYMMNYSEYFKSYETYVFERGSHTPHHQLRISNVTNLTLMGTNMGQSFEKVVIDCNGAYTNFSFFYSSNIVIADLVFNYCIHVHPYNKSKSVIALAIIVFVNGTNFSMLNVSILKCADDAFYIQNALGNLIIENVEVANCSIDKDIKYFFSGNIIIYNHYCFWTKSDILIRNTRFIQNVNDLSEVWLLVASSLTISLNCANIKVKIVNITMLNNRGNSSGNLAIMIYPARSNISVELVNSTIEGGYALKGAGMTVMFGEIQGRNFSCNNILSQKKKMYVYNTNFTNNIAMVHGSAVYIRYKESLLKCNKMILVKFENVNFINNSVNCITGDECGGGIVFHYFGMMVTGYLYHGTPQIQVVLNNCCFMSNRVIPFVNDSGTGVIFVKSSHFFQLNNTSILHNSATGILGISSNIILAENITILHNTGYNGGGMFLSQNAMMFLKAYTKVTIAYNKAQSIGGGICVQTDFLESQPICFYQLDHDLLKNNSLTGTISVSLHNNIAISGGDNIFGGSIKHCYLIQYDNYDDFHSEKLFREIFKVQYNTIAQLSSISSPPHRICICQNMKPHCNIPPPFHLQKFPGETFTVDVVLVGQFNGTVPGTVQASLKHSRLKGGHIQNVSSTVCSQLKYTLLYTGHNYEILYLRVQHVEDIRGFEESQKFNKFIIKIKMKDCLFGFSLTSNNNSLCDCHKFSKRYSEYVNCDITNRTIKRSPPSWIGFIRKQNGSKRVAFHTFCPFDYCLRSKVELFATDNSLTQDAQCAFNRTGVLCGSCSEGLSIVLGTTKCHHCSNYWLLLIIPFALSGIGLLIVMILFDINIADGTLSGIIFYFNVVGNNFSVFFSSQSGQSITIITSVLKLVISFINLQTGIPMCLFDGMDAYIKAWLEFCFPLYLWILTGCFIFLARARYYWIVRRNAVKVLATLILLSYTRLLMALSTALHVSKVHVEGQEYELRWPADGNIKYFRGKHILLALFAVLLGFLLLPFALCLLFIQCLQKVSKHKVFSWVNRLKPIFDVYTSPYTSQGRFWTGLLLLFRCVLLMITAVNVNGNPNTVLGVISITVVLLLLIAGLLSAGLYRRRCLNALEYSSLVNLGILSSLLCIFTYSTVISHIFVSIEIFVLIGVIVHHFTTLKVVRKHSCCEKLMMFQNFARHFRKNNEAKADNDEVHNNNIVRFPYYVPEDREPLLATDN